MVRGKSGNPRPPKPGGGAADIFGDKRSGRDRRDLEVSVDDTRRQRSDRRTRAVAAKTSWWLERDYVESHHFVQKAARLHRMGDEESA